MQSKCPQPLVELAADVCAVTAQASGPSPLLKKGNCNCSAQILVKPRLVMASGPLGKQSSRDSSGWSQEFFASGLSPSFGSSGQIAFSRSTPPAASNVSRTCNGSPPEQRQHAASAS
eukprot:CAMPEP_0197680576 /NCGR_PEP_ID=MMETSP1338-20131121/93549_1 /TAXON_ID=43686 ORGANISM="Pelagodinium beii, Strain RCC1491" /NCGR_SAMPLE_ID=MMETSP1338 /ASSEMBLY_ACC=CAM_ASM_000754 /LENGTH=116 /DNA_ID=CAMNT_0043261783 /DNA_START=257 /DNA_END=607 /DNA_ORIENTATION=+